VRSEERVVTIRYSVTKAPACVTPLRNSGSQVGKIQHVEGAPRRPAAPRSGHRGAREPAPPGQTRGGARRGVRHPVWCGNRSRAPAGPRGAIGPPPFDPCNRRPQSGLGAGDRTASPDWHVTGKAHSGRPHHPRAFSRPGRPGPSPRGGTRVAGGSSRQAELWWSRDGSAYPVERCKSPHLGNLRPGSRSPEPEPDRPELGLGGAASEPPWNRPCPRPGDSGISPGEGVIRRSVGSGPGFWLWSFTGGPFEPPVDRTVTMDLDPSLRETGTA